MLINNVEINVSFPEWRHTIVDLARRFRIYKAAKRKLNILVFVLMLLAAFLTFTFLPLCINSFESSTAFRLIISVIAMFIVWCIANMIRDDNEFKTDYKKIKSSEMNEIMTYVDDAESDQQRDLFDYLCNVPYIHRLVPNWPYIQLLYKNQSLVYTGENEHKVVFYNKQTRERIQIDVDYIYASDNDNAQYTLLVNEQSMILYEPEEFDKVVNVQLINQ